MKKDEDMVKEIIEEFENGELIDAPERIPHQDEAEIARFLLPKIQIEILKEFAKRNNVTLSLLVSRWLRDRIRQERDKLKDK
jgi:hypothetical protein